VGKRNIKFRRREKNECDLKKTNLRKDPRQNNHKPGTEVWGKETDNGNRRPTRRKKKIRKKTLG